MRIVLDVNILASAVGSRDGLPFQVFTWCLVHPHRLVLSEAMIATLESVLKRPYFDSQVTAQQRSEFVRLVRERAETEDPDLSVTGVADDEEDDRVLGTAVAGRANIIVTGDKGMLAIGSFIGIPIVTARTFLDLIDH